MKFAMTVCVLLATTLTSPAAELSESLVLWETAKARKDYAPDIVRAAVESVIFLDNGMTCSGQLVSNSGHFLTDLHCIFRSILNRGPRVNILMGEQPPHYKGFEIRDPTQLPYRTEVLESAGRWLRLEGVVGEPQVVATGRGFFEYPPMIQTQEHFDRLASDFESLKKFQEDFSILSFETAKQIKKTCVATANRIPPVGSTAWAVGFPENFVAGQNVVKKYISKGKIYPDFGELKKANGTIGVYPEEAWFDSERFFLFTGKAISGMSGGGVFSEDGLLIGQIVAISSSGASIIQRIDFVKKSVEKSLGLMRADEIFNCLASERKSP